MNHLLSLSTLRQQDFMGLLGRACSYASMQRPDPLLAARCVGLEFRKTSTRTRTSFAAAAVRLGAHPIIYGPNDLQTNTGETLEDTAAVLSKYLEMLVIRSAGNPAELIAMADCNRLPIINAMSAEEHPTQALSDLAAIRRHFGELKHLTLFYVGEANNTAVALAFAVARVPGMRAEFRTPPGYGFAPAIWQVAQRLSAEFGGSIHACEEPPTQRDSGTADIVYATRWQTTGTAKANPAWRQDFEPFRVTARMMSMLGRSRDSVFMHDLPAHRGEDCEAAVLDGPQSIALFQAEQKLFTAMAVLEWCAQR